MVAARAERVLEAQYQDAVRQRIDDVYGAFVTALAARQTVRYAKQSADRLDDVTERNEQRFQKGDISLADLNQVRIRLRTARLGLVDAEAAYRKAKLDLGSLMNLKLEEIARLELKGTIKDVAPPPPPVEELRKLAVAERPDIVSVRLGVHRAEADCSAGQGQRIQRCLCSLAAIYLPGQHAIRLEEPVFLGPGRDRALADLQPQPGWDLPGQDQRDADRDRARGPGTAGPDRRRGGRPGIRGHAPRGGRAQGACPTTGQASARRRLQALERGSTAASSTTWTLSSTTTRPSSNISTRRSATGAACSRSIRSWAGGSCPDRVESEESWSGRVRDLREEKMGRRIPRDLRPFLEEFERRELLSAITDVMAANSLAAGRGIAISRHASDLVAVDRGPGESRPAQWHSTWPSHRREP